ncbi:uncharacterized protein LOC144096948 [Amblyomma americanum]
MKQKLQLVLGVQLQTINQSIVDSLVSSCDILIFVNHHIIEPPSCKVSRPSHIPVTKHHRMIMQRVGDSSSKKPVPCISVSLAVHDYRLQSLHGRFMDDCINSKWVNYERTCPSKSGSIEKDQEWGAAYVKTNTTMLVFEDEETIVDKVDSFLEDSPHGCVAAFHVEYEDFIGRCVARERYSRLQSISKALQRKKFPRQVDHKPGTEELCERGGPKEKCHKRLLVCTVSMKARNVARLGQLCSHVVFLDAVYDYESEDFSVLEQDMNAFLSIKGSKHLAALSPFVITKDTFETKQKEHVLKAVRGLLSRYSSLDGIGVFSMKNTQMELLVQFFSDMKANQRSNDPKRILLAGLAYRHAAAYLSRLQGICDIIVFMTHHYTMAMRCRISTPTLYMLTIDDILQMKKVMKPAHGMTSATCVSINLVVRAFKGPGNGEFNDACEQEAWFNYAQVCPSEDMALHTFHNTSVYWKNSTDMLVFENEGTLTDKVSHFLALHPAGCVALFGADKDDIAGQCSLWEPAPRVKVVNRLLFYVPMSPTVHPILEDKGKGGTTEPTGSELISDQDAKMTKRFFRSPTGGVLICAFKSDLLALKIAQEQCTHLVYMDVEYDTQGQFLIKNRTSFENFMSSKLTMRQLLFVGLPPSVIEYLDTEDKINSFITHGTAFLDDDALDGFAFFSDASTKPGRLKQVAEATVKQFREHSRPPHLLMLAVHVGIAADFGSFMEVSDILVLLAHSYEPSSVDCRVEYPSESSFTEKLFQVSKKLFAKSKEKRGQAACMSINLAVRQFDIKDGKKELGSKCTSERWENYAKTCPNVKIHTQRGSQNVAAYRLDGTSFLTFEDEETVSIKVLRYLQGNSAPCIAAFRVDAEDSCGACTAREKASRLMAISRLLFPTTECSSSTEGTPSVPPTRTPSVVPTSPTELSETLVLTSAAKPSETPMPKQTAGRFTHTSQTIDHGSMDTERRSTTEVSVAYTRGPSRSQRDRAVLCISAASVSENELLLHFCTHIVVTRPEKMFWNAAFSPDRGEPDRFKGTELLLSMGMAHDILTFERGFARLVLRALVSMKMDGYALFSGPNTNPDALLRTVKDIWQVFDENKNHKEYTLVVGAVRAILDKVIREPDLESDYIVLLPDRLETPANCMTNASYFVYDDPILLNKWLRSRNSNAMLAISIFLPVVIYDISKHDSKYGTFCSKEEWHSYAMSCFSYGFKKEYRDRYDPILLHSAYQLMVYEDEMTIADRISAVSARTPNISVAAFYVESEDLVGSCERREPASRLAAISQLITRRPGVIPKSTPGPLIRRKINTGPSASLICVYSKEISFPGLLLQVCDYIVYMNITLREHAREARVQFDPGYDQLVALDRDQVKGLLLAPEPNFIKSLMQVEKSQLEGYLQLAHDKVKQAKISGLAFFFPDAPLAQAYKLYEKAWKFFSRTKNRIMLLVGLTYVSDLQQLKKFAKKCDFLVLVKHDYTVPSKCVVSGPFLKPIEKQDYENLATLVRESQSLTTVGLSLPMVVSEYRLNSAAEAIGTPCNYQRWTGYAKTCPNLKRRTQYDDNFTRSFQRNGSTLYSFQDELVVAQQVQSFLHRFDRGCIAAFYVEYEDWTGECNVRQPITRLKMIISQLNWTEDTQSRLTDSTTSEALPTTRAKSTVASKTTPEVLLTTRAESPMTQTTTPEALNTTRAESTVADKATQKIFQAATTFIICLFSRRLPNLSLAAQLCPYMAYMGLMHYSSSDRFYINDAAALYQFLALKHYNVQGLLIATAPMNSDLLTKLREVFLHDGVARLMYSISKTNPFETLYGVMLQTTSITDLDSLYEESLKIRIYLKRKLRLKLFLAVQTAGYNTSLAPLLKLKSSCDRLILYTTPYLPSPHCKILPTAYQDLAELDKTIFSPKKGEMTPCFTVNLGVRRYELMDKKFEFGQDCAKESWEKYSTTCPNVSGERGYTSTSVYLKTSTDVFVFEDETTIQKKLSQLRRITPNICVMATTIEKEDWDHECANRSAASRMLAIHSYRDKEPTTPASPQKGQTLYVLGPPLPLCASF